MPPIPEGLVAALADRYRLTRELGAGGMATVYLAEDLKHPRQVAVKVLRPDLAATLGPDRFIREVGIAARLSHPHIVGLLDSGEAAGFLYYVMPYVEGTSLRQKLQREGELPIPEAVRILRDVADALAYAHSQGVVHRDVKPENIMLVARHALVMDFGVAKAVAEGKEASTSSLTSAGTALGTPAYMAPEQAAGDANVDHRADLYAWGILAYELLAGQPPFVRNTPQKTLAAQVTATPEPVTHHRANVPGPLAHLVMQCLEKKAADRPQSAEEVLHQLDQVLTPSGGMTPTDTRPYQTAAARRARRRTLLTGATVVAGLAVVGLLTWRWWQGRAEPIVAERVLVAPLEAEGEGFEGLARDLAALPTAMDREGIGTPVPAATVRDLAARRGGSDAAAQAEYLGRRTGAGYVLRTSCAPQGAGAACQLELFQRPGNRLRMAVPVRGAGLDSAFSARVQEQALAMLLVERYWGDQTTWLGEYVPSSLGAVRAFHRAWEDTWISDELIEQAALADSNWVAIYSLWQASRPDFTTAQQDSALAVLARRPGLTERDQLTIQVRRCAGCDPERVFEVLRQLYRGWPALWHLLYVKEAVATNHAQAAVDAVARADSLPATKPWRAWENFYIASALHQLGRYQDQLARARALRALPPQAWEGAMATAHKVRAGLWQALEIQGYAGLGQVDSLRRIVAELDGESWYSGAWLTSEVLEDLGLSAALELMAHRNEAAGLALLRESLPAMRRLRESEGNFTLAENEVWALEWTGELDQARALAEQILRERPMVGHVPEMLGSLGKIAARQGRREDALGISRALADSAVAWRERPLSGALAPEGRVASYLYYRAAIAARLGEREQAVSLLRDAHGVWMGLVPGDFIWLHKDPDFASLRGYPPFEALLAPKD
jgi:hypothetical protein